MDIDQRIQFMIKLQKAIRSISWPNNSQEPDYVAMLASLLPGIITVILKQIFPYRSITAGDAFIHQKPLAHFVNRFGMRDPELGDLLIVCREKRFSGYVYNSMLLQAKLTKNPLNTSCPNDHQFLLYSEWPEFEYRRAGYLNKKRRSVIPKTISQGAQYLLIDQSNIIDFFTATVNRPLNGSRTFAGTLAAILSFEVGKTFKVTNPRDDWSQMIVDLLHLSATSMFNRRRSGYVGKKRLNCDEMFNLLLNSGEMEEGLISEQIINDENEGSSMGGMRIICVDLGISQDE